MTIFSTKWRNLSLKILGYQCREKLVEIDLFTSNAKQVSILRKSKLVTLRGVNLTFGRWTDPISPFLDPLPPLRGHFFPNEDKNIYFLTKYLPILVHVVIEHPQKSFSHKHFHTSIYRPFWQFSKLKFLKTFVIVMSSSWR